MSYFSQREVVGGSVVLAFGLAVGGFLESKLHLFSGSSYKGLEGTVAVQSVSPQNGQEQSGTEDGLRKSIKGNPVKLVKSEISVHDGDTIKYHGESFRLAGIDCAEVKTVGGLISTVLESFRILIMGRREEHMLLMLFKLHKE